MLRGKLAVLKPLEWEDLELLHKWYLNPEVIYWASGAHPDTFYTRYELEERYEREARSDNIKRFMIETADGEQVGLVTSKVQDKQVRSATVGILIGEREYWNQGIGTDAMKAFLQYLFDYWNFNRVELETWDGNTRAIRTYEKCGFQIEGRLRQNFFINGEYRDRIVMGIIRSDYDQCKGEWFD